MICLALWSQPGSRPRISPQRHNYHTGLNVPPTSHGTHQSPSVLSPNLFSSGSFNGSLSIICMFYSHPLPVWSSFPISHFSVTPSFHHYAGNNGRWALLFLRRGEGCGMEAVHDSLSVKKGHMFYFQVTRTHNCLPEWIFKQTHSLCARCRQLKSEEVGQSERQPAVVGPTNEECVRGVDLAVRRRIKWLIGGARRGEGVKRSALPPSLLLSLPLSLSLSLPSPAKRKGHWGWTNKSHGHQTLLTTAALGLHSDGVLLVSAVCSYPHPKGARTVWTHARMHANIHAAESPRQHDSGFTSPHSVRSLIPRVALEQHQQYERREKGERGTIQLLDCCYSALQGSCR